MEHKNKYPKELSGGMKKKLCIARALAYSNYDILLLDEPFNGIDKEGKLELIRKIKGIIPERSTVIIVTHDEEEAKQLGENIIYI